MLHIDNMSGKFSYTKPEIFRAMFMKGVPRQAEVAQGVPGS